MASKTSASGNRLIANNKKAYFDYFIEEKYEAGMVLHGTEVKSIRAGKCSIKESYIKIENGEVYVLGMNITPYEKGNIFNKDPVSLLICFFTRIRLISLQVNLQLKVTHLFHFRYI